MIAPNPATSSICKRCNIDIVYWTNLKLWVPAGFDRITLALIEKDVPKLFDKVPPNRYVPHTPIDDLTFLVIESTKGDRG